MNSLTPVMETVSPRTALALAQAVDRAAAKATEARGQDAALESFGKWLDWWFEHRAQKAAEDGGILESREQQKVLRRLETAIRQGDSAMVRRLLSQLGGSAGAYGGTVFAATTKQVFEERLTPEAIAGAHRGPQPRLRDTPYAVGAPRRPPHDRA